MADLNIVALVGRITKDATVEKTPNGTSTCRFTLASNGIRKDDTSFISCVAWRQSADYLGQYAKKGDVIIVKGALKSRSYDNREGVHVFVTEVNAEQVQIISRHKESSYAAEPAVEEDQFAGTPELDVRMEDLPF